MTLQTENELIDSEIKQNKWGPRFKAAREAMNLSEKDAAARLNLKPHIISIIESEHFQSGPPPIFMRGYLKSYAKLLNFTDKEIDQILLQLSISHPEIINASRSIRPERTPSPSNAPSNYTGWTTAVVVLVLAGLVGTWWSNHTKAPSDKTDLAAQTVEAPAPTVASSTPAEPTPHELTQVAPQPANTSNTPEAAAPAQANTASNNAPANLAQVTPAAPDTAQNNTQNPAPAAAPVTLATAAPQGTVGPQAQQPAPTAAPTNTDAATPPATQTKPADTNESKPAQAKSTNNAEDEENDTSNPSDAEMAIPQEQGLETQDN